MAAGGDPARPQVANHPQHAQVAVDEHHVDREAHAEGVHRAAAPDQQRVVAVHAT